MQPTTSTPPTPVPTYGAEELDSELVQRMRAGETQLYAVLMHRYRARLYGIARAVLQNEADVEDTLQETHVNVLKHLDQFAGRASFFTWVGRITLYEALARVRRKQRFQQLDAMPSAAWTQMAAANGDHLRNPEQRAINAEFEQLIQGALQMLPGKYRSVFVLRGIEELSTIDVAHRLGISDTCVRTRLLRARSILQRRFRGRLRLPRGCAAGGHQDDQVDRSVHRVPGNRRER